MSEDVSGVSVICAKCGVEITDPTCFSGPNMEPICRACWDKAIKHEQLKALAQRNVCDLSAAEIIELLMQAMAAEWAKWCGDASSDPPSG